MVPSRWFSRGGPFVGAHYALENGSGQLRRREEDDLEGPGERLV